MKYVIFLTVLAAGVPLAALLASWRPIGKRLLLALLVMSPMAGWMGKINFLSMESYRGPDRGFEVTLTDLIAAGLALSLLFDRQLRRIWVPYNALPLLAYFAACCVSLVATPVPLFSAFTVFKLVRCGFLYWVVVNAVRSEEDVRWALGGWMVVGLWLASVAGFQKYVQGVYRVPGPFDHSNVIPLYVNLVLPAVLVWGVVDPRLPPAARPLFVTSLCGMLFAVVATASRAGIALAAASVLACAALMLGRAFSARSLGVLSMLAAVCCVGSIRAYDTLTERFFNAPAESAESRVEFNVAARLMLEDRPLGVGVNAFSHVLTDEPEYREHLVALAHEAQAGVAHNIYFLTLAEVGYAGLAAFLVAMARFLWLALRAAAGPVSPLRLLAASIAIGMASLHLAGFLEWGFRLTPVLYQYVFVAGLAVALARLTVPRHARDARASW